MSFRRGTKEKLALLRKAGVPAVKSNLRLLRGKSKYKRKDLQGK